MRATVSRQVRWNVAGKFMICLRSLHKTTTWLLLYCFATQKMHSYGSKGDPFINSHFSTSSSSRNSPSRQSISNRRSTASLRPPSAIPNVVDDEPPNGRHHSLAHELAVALMPEPSSGSKLLADEFGIEFDEGAEGIDDPVDHRELEPGVHFVVDDDADVPSLADGLASHSGATSFREASPEASDSYPDYDPVFESPTFVRTRPKQQKPEQDAMQVLSQNLESTDKFLNHLRKLDTDGTSQQPALERIASDVIRRMNESVRDRESQLRELLEYEREFRKIAGEVGGSDVLGRLDELPDVDDFSESHSTQEVQRGDARHLDPVEEEQPISPHNLSHSHDWELDPDRRLGDEDDDDEPVRSPIKDAFPAPPPINGPPTPAKTIPQLAHLRSFTTSLVTSLSTISEQAQVNGAATTDAGRKIRSLKNKIGGWRMDWDNAERSRIRIDRWEAGIIDGDENDAISTPTKMAGMKRIDGRKIVQEHLLAFELALADAALKTQAIMAR